MVGRKCVSLSLRICTHCVISLLSHIVLLFILGVISVIIGCICIFPLVSLGRSFLYHSIVTMHPLWRWCYLKLVLLLLCLLFVYWPLLLNRWGCPLPQVLAGDVSPFGIYNCKQFGHRWHPFSYVLVFFHVPGKRWSCSPLLYLLPLVSSVPNN